MNTKSLGLNNLITFIKYTLFVSVFAAVLDVIWKVIENKFAVNEYANTLDYGSYGDTYLYDMAQISDAHIALTLVIVLTPLFFLASWYRNTLIEKGGERNTPLFAVINWSFVAISTFTLLSAFILSVYILIGGKQTLAGQLELLTVVTMFGLLLYRSILNIRNKAVTTLGRNKKMLLAAPYLAFVFFAIVVGFMYANPKITISLQADKDRISDLGSDMSEVKYYLKDKGTLPKDLSTISKDKNYYFIKKDKDGKDYEYNFISSNVSTSSKLSMSCYNNEIADGYKESEAVRNCTDIIYAGSASYNVCATFDNAYTNPKDTEADAKDISTWEHKAGKDCFKVDLTADDLNGSSNLDYKNYDY